MPHHQVPQENLVIDIIKFVAVRCWTRQLQQLTPPRQFVPRRHTLVEG
jgi:hypothetical protein